MKSAPTPQKSPSWQSWLASFIAVSIAILIFGLILYHTETERVEREKFQELTTIGQLKANEISTWRRERLSDIVVSVKSPLFRRALGDWLRNPSDKNLEKDLRERMSLTVSEEDYVNAILLDLSGNVLLSVSESPEPVGKPTRDAIETSKKTEMPTIGELYSSNTGRVLIDTVMPFIDNDGTHLAIYLLRIDASKFLYPLIESWPTPSETAETLLVRRDGDEVVFLNKLRHRTGLPLTVKHGLSNPRLPAARAILGKRGIFEGLDYRGNPVLADLIQVPNSPWFLVAKVDRSEILRPVFIRGISILAFSCVLVVTLAGGFAFFYRSKQLSLYQSLYVMEQQQKEAQGEFKTTLYSIGDAVVTTDSNALVRHMNHRAEILTGWSETGAAGKPISEVLKIIDEESRELIENPVVIVLRTGRGAQLKKGAILIRKDGSEIPIDDSASPLFDDSRRLFGAVIVFRDQTIERATLKALSASEEKFRLMFEFSPLGIFHFNSNGVITDCNKNFVNIIGSSREKLIGLDMLHDLQDRKMVEVIKTALSGDVSRYEGCYSSVTAKKTTPVKCEFAPVVSESKITGGMGIVEDITKRQLSDEIVQTRVRLFEFAVSHSLAELLQKTLDEIGNLTKSPIGFYHFIEEDEKTIILQDWSSKTVNEFCHATGLGEHYPLDQAGVWADAVRTKKPIIHNDYASIEGKKGMPEGHAEVMRELVVPIMRADRVVGVLGIGNRETPYTEEDVGIVSYIADVAWEIATQKRTENALKESEAKYREVVENASSIILGMDPEGNLTFLNEFGQKFFDYSEDELVGKNVVGTIVPELESTGRRLSDLMKEICSSPEAFEKNLNENVLKNGTRVWIEWTNKAVRSDTGELLSIFCIGSDVTDKKKAETDRELLILKLQDALSKVKTLSGLLPICSSCKKIRDDSGYWQQLETFVKEHSGAEFTHGICPDCEKEMYRELGALKRID